MRNKQTHPKPEVPPPPDEQTLREYFQLTADIESEIKRISNTLPESILQCGPGCSRCCIEFSVFPLEAAILISGTKSPAIDHVPRAQGCIFLINDRCSIYEARPILCRTQGLPIGYLNDGESSIEVSACSVNFPDDYRFSTDEILMMDHFNYRLAELNRRYCEEVRLDPHQRIPLSDLIANIRKQR